MAKRKEFGNILDIPINFSSPTFDQDIKDREIALYNHYGLKRPNNIDKDSQQLIHQLCKELKIQAFIPLNKKAVVGRPNKWNNTYGLIFSSRVDLYKKQNPSKSLRECIDFIRRQYYQKIKLDTLYVRYNEIIKKEHKNTITNELVKYIVSSDNFSKDSKISVLDFIEKETQ